MADSSVVTALAALGGSAVGALASSLTAYHTQRYQGRRERSARELERREALYGAFIEKAAVLFLDSLDKDLDDLTGPVELVTVLARIRLASSDPVVEAADDLLRELIASYRRPPIARREVFDQTREDFHDPLTAFTAACRKEREQMLTGL